MYPDNNNQESAQSNARQRIAWRRLGLIHITTLLLGSIVLLLTSLALGLIWKESISAISGAEPNKYWIWLVEVNWITRVITICTAAMRTVITLQASVITAMLAGVIIESIGAPLSRGPYYSIIRAIGTAPHSLLSAAQLQSVTLLSFTIYAIILFEVLVTGASQFLSTIFLSDFTEGTFASTSSSTKVYTMAKARLWSVDNTEWWSMPPASGWTFAELSEPFIEGKNFHDTGHTYRAFLPFEDESQRIKLRRFRGPAPVMDQRVVCASPSLENLTLEVQEILQLTGKVALDVESYPMLEDKSSQKPVEFFCDLPPPLESMEKTTGESSLCIPAEGWSWKVLLKDPLVDPLDTINRPPTSYEGYTGYPNGSTMFILFDVVSTEAVLLAHNSGSKIEAVRNDGPWAMIANGMGAEAVRVTACVTNLGARTFEVDMKRSWEGSEPKIRWDTQREDYNVEASQVQLKVSPLPQSFKERGILMLGNKSQWRDSATAANETAAESLWFFSLSVAMSMRRPGREFATGDFLGDQGVILSRITSTGVDGFAHRTHTTLFQEILRTTRSPSLATQALLARIHQMAYYGWITMLRPEETAVASFSSTKLIPTRWHGFILATSLLVAHLTITATIVTLFLVLTSNSLLGNSWQAISQVVSDDTRQTINEASMIKDKDIRNWAKSNSINLQRPGILRPQPDGRVALSTMEV